MADSKKPEAKQVHDVAKPGKSAPSDTAKPIITHRPMMKDPMVNEASDTIAEDSPAEKIVVKTSKANIQPLAATEAPEKDEKTVAEITETAKESKPEPEAEPKAEEPAEEPDASENEDSPAEEKPTKSAAEKSEQEADAEAAKHEAEIQKLIDGKQYFLPINAVEKRKSKRFVVVGIALSLLLVLAWADIALDAGLIEVSGVKPVTHFFSN